MRVFYYNLKKNNDFSYYPEILKYRESYYSQPVKTRKPLFHRHLKISP